MLEKGSRSGFSYSASFCPVNFCEWRINILWKWGLIDPPRLLLLPGRSLQGQDGAPSDGAGWGNPMEKHTELTPASPHERTHYSVLQVPTFEQLSNEEPGKAYTFALLLSLMSQEKSKSKSATDCWNKAEESPTHQKEPHVPQVGQHHWPGTTKPPACISSRFLLFTNLHFMPPCSKRKQKPWRAFSCCHRNSYYNLKLYLMHHSSPSSTLQQLAVPIGRLCCERRKRGDERALTAHVLCWRPSISAAAHNLLSISGQTLSFFSSLFLSCFLFFGVSHHLHLWKEFSWGCKDSSNCLWSDQPCA